MTLRIRTAGAEVKALLVLDRATGQTLDRHQIDLDQVLQEKVG